MPRILDGITRGRAGRRLSPRSLLMPGLFALAAVLFIYPVAMLVVGAFRNSDPSVPPEWSLRGFSLAYSNAETYETLKNSVVLAVSVTVIATILGVLFAFLATRTTTPLRRLITPMMVLVIALPPLFFTLGWAFLGDPRVGLINKFASTLAGSDITILNVFSWFGIIFVISLKGASFGYFLMLGPFRAIDRGLEEASQVSGAGWLTTLIRVELPVLAPAITSVAIINLIVGLEIFETPMILGFSNGIEVFATRVYGLIGDHTPAEYGASSAIALLLVAIMIGLVALQWRILGRRKFTTVTGKGHNTNRWEIGRAWRYGGTVLIVVYGLVALVLPLLQLVLSSLQSVFGLYDSWTLDNYREIWQSPEVAEALRTTLVVAILGGLLAMALAFVLTYAATRSRSRLRRPLELTTWLPLAVPGVVLSLGMAWAYLSLPGLRLLYGTIGLVMLGLAVAAVPIAARIAQPAIQQVGEELEESARMAGATPVRTVVDIVLPLVQRSFLAGWFVTALVISGNLAIPILLASPETETISLTAFNFYRNGYPSKAAAVSVLVLAILVLGLIAIRLIGWLVERGMRWRGRSSVPYGGIDTSDLEAADVPAREEAAASR